MPRNPKQDLNVWTFVAHHDHRSISNRASKSDKSLAKKKRFCYGSTSSSGKDHHAIVKSYPVFTVELDEEDEGSRANIPKKQPTALQTINGLIVDPKRIANEGKLLERTRFMGVAHSEQCENEWDAFITAKSRLFDVAYFGPVTLMNFTFHPTIRSEDGYILKSSGTPVQTVRTGDRLTLTFFPFDFDMAKKIERLAPEARKALKDSGYLTNQACYDPSMREYYDWWYGRRNCPREWKESERMIAVWEKLPRSLEPKEEGIREVGKHLRDRLVTYRRSFDDLYRTENYDELTGDGKRLLELIFGKGKGKSGHGEIVKKVREGVVGEALGEEYLGRLVDTGLREFVGKLWGTGKAVHFKVLGDPKGNSEVAFGSEMHGVLMMHRSP